MRNVLVWGSQWRLLICSLSSHARKDRETKLTSVSKSLLPEKSKQSWFELKKWLFQCLPPIRDYLRDMAVVRLLRLGDADASELGIN